MSKINSVKAREMLDSRGNPTAEVNIVLDDSVTGRATVSPGALIGTGEAMELRDNDKSRFHGKGVKTVVESVTKIIAPKIIGVDVLEQWKIDQLLIALDGTKSKSRLGANAILGVSTAAVRAVSNLLNISPLRYIGGSSAYELPVPVMNTLNGGKHAGDAVDVQEFMIMPTGTSSFATALRTYSEVYQTLKVMIKGQGMNTAVGDEGGSTPGLATNEGALKLIVEAIEKIGYGPGEDVLIALDPTASEFYMDGKYVFQEEKTNRSSKKMIVLYSDWVNRYPTVPPENGLTKNGWDDRATLTAKLDNKMQLIGDDIFTMNPEILQEGISKHIANSILTKLNQIGTPSETLDTIQMMHTIGYTTVISYRSGETEDMVIVDVVVAINAGQIKSGVPCRTEGIMKYNQLLRIEEPLGDSA